MSDIASLLWGSFVQYAMRRSPARQLAKIRLSLVWRLSAICVRIAPARWTASSAVHMPPDSAFTLHLAQSTDTKPLTTARLRVVPTPPSAKRAQSRALAADRRTRWSTATDLANCKSSFSSIAHMRRRGNTAEPRGSSIVNAQKPPARAQDAVGLPHCVVAEKQYLPSFGVLYVPLSRRSALRRCEVACTALLF